jgi:hypothetical protein
MTHIHGMQDADLHDKDGGHIRPVYQAPCERMPDSDEIASVTGPVIRGRDVERAEAAYRAALARYENHLAAHKEK